jgi:hypothetical protein
VGCERGPGLVAGDVLDHHHAAARLAQGRCRRLRDEEASLRGRPEGRVPVGLVELFERLRREALARRIDQQVEPAELLNGALDERPRLAGL